jgi:hypothetical protein
MNHIYDQVIQNWCTQKILGQLAGQDDVAVTDEELEEDSEKAEDENDDQKNFRRNKLIEAKADALYIQLLGL